MTTTSDRTIFPAPRRRVLGAASRTAEFSEVFTAALEGEPCQVLAMRGVERLLPVARWDADADTSDDAVLALCEGSTLDSGCGPGRLTSRLAELGHVTLGVDIVAAAVRRTRDRGVSAVHRDLFERLPGEGRWQTALLADGNIGIGGDPRALLARMAELVAPGGRVVVEAAAPGGGLRVHDVRLRCAGLVTRAFPWAVLAVDHIDALLTDLPLGLLEVHQICRGDQPRWVAVLTRDAA